MRRRDREIDDQEIIGKIFETEKICRIAFAIDREPYLVPLNYGYCHPYLYFHSAPEGRKIAMLKKNNRVCFEIESRVEIITGSEACNYSTHYRSLIGYGLLEPVTTREEICTGLDIIMKQHGFEGQATYREEYLSRMLVLRLLIEQVSCKQNGVF